MVHALRRHRGGVGWCMSQPQNLTNYNGARYVTHLFLPACLLACFPVRSLVARLEVHERPSRCLFGQNRG